MISDDELTEQDLGDGWTLSYADLGNGLKYFLISKIYNGGIGATNSTLFSRPIPFSVKFTQRCHVNIHSAGLPVAEGYASFSKEGLRWGHQSTASSCQCDIYGIIKL